MKKKTIALIVCLTLIIGCAVGGTIAWLTDKTAAVTNTFTAGDVDIDLTETDVEGDGTLTANSYKMVPGNTITKDPKVTVVAGSEACWLFVKVEKSANYSTYLEDYVMATGWKELTAGSGVYYRAVDASSTDQVFTVLASKEGYPDGYVVVKESVTKSDLETAKTTPPTLKFTAYACQKDNVATAAEAWEKVNPTTAP